MTESRILAAETSGAIVAYDVAGLPKGVLIGGPGREAIAAGLLADGARPVAEGRLALRLGVALHDRPFLFVPHSIIDERGATFQGEVVFDWLQARAYDMPRSEIFGVDARGRENQIFAREVDVESSPIVVGGSPSAPVYVAARLGAVDLPDRFAAALRVCASADPLQVRLTLEAA